MRIVAAASVLLGCTMSRADDWPMFMHDSGHTGVSSEELQPPLRQAWEFPLGQSSAAPVVARGTAYVGNWAGEFFAVDAVARTLKWKAKTGGPICYAAAVGAGKVVVGSADGIFYAFDAQSGQQVWKHATAPDPADNA
jgi:outer membrane protein assembly factor BamB